MVKDILLVDDDVDFRTTLAEQLLGTGDFDVFEAGDAVEAISKIKSQRFDLMIFDVNLPDTDGRDMVRVIRERGIDTPVIMLTAQSADADTVRGLEAGANDYVTKPFRLSVLLARINAQIRVHDLTEDATFRIGPYHFRPNQKTLEDTTSGKTLRLTEKEASILRFLYRAKGKPVSRDTLLGEVWGYVNGVTTHTLETHIYRLRQKIETPEVGRLIETSSGGYFLVRSEEKIS